MLCGRKVRPGCITGIYGKLHSIDCWRLSDSSSSPYFPIICRKPFSTRSTGCGNHYQVLGIQRYASQDEIKQAFYMLTKKYHPDVVGSSDGTNQKFLEIREAYETLRDEQKRRIYDRKFMEYEELGTATNAGTWKRANRKQNAKNDSRYRNETEQEQILRMEKTRKNHEKIWWSQYQDQMEEMWRHEMQGWRRRRNLQRVSMVFYLAAIYIIYKLISTTLIID